MKKIFLSLAIVVSLLSCDDQLDRLPKDSLVSSTAYKSVADLKLGLNGVYGTYSNNPIITFNSIFTDECKIGADNGGQQVLLYNQVLNPSQNAAGIWAARYQTINFANRIIEAATTISPSASELADYNNVLAQMYGLRALCHLDLMNHYTVDPTNLSSLAIPYADFVVTTETLGRNTVQEVRDAILNDINTANGLIGTASDIYFVTPEFLDFIKAKIYFLTGNYTDAITVADDLINNMSLATPTQYTNMFSDLDNTEIIFKRKRTQIEGFIGGIWYFTGTGGAFMEMSNNMYNSLPVNDVRTNVLFDSANSNPANNFHLINKYPGSGGFLFLNDEKIMRLSEVYLIKAECQARLSLFSDAATTIKDLRDVRSTAGPTALDTYVTLADAANAILAERNIELGYEGHRYVDVKRLRNVVNVGFVRDPLDCGGASPCTLPVNDPRFTMPIPQAEIDVNPNIQGQQNPGY